MQIALLGPLEVTIAGSPVVVAGSRLRALVARLAVGAPRPVPAGELVESIWGFDPPADAANALQSLVSRLRRALGDPGAVVADSAGYRIPIEREAVDLHRFDDLAGQAHRRHRDGHPDQALDICSAALALWRGDPLADAGDADYATAVITAAQNRRLELLSLRMEALLALGRAAESIPELEQLVAAHPLREQFVAHLMRALAASGRGNEALVAFERFRRLLADQLGADPGPELQSLHLALLRGELQPPADPVPAVRQTGPKTNLRNGLTSFVGREAELDRLAHALDTSRLTTVVGPGGAGKTRIAAEAARQWMERHQRSAWMIELAPVGTAENIPGAMLTALGMTDPSALERLERGGSDEIRRLRDHLAGSDALLVIDNCEHLIEPVARLVEQLLITAPDLRVLTTSREPLALTAETLCPLPPLRLPPADCDLEQAGQYAAVQLWLDRAAAIVPGYRLTSEQLPYVIDIVRRLDGLPLAIELAAARLRALPVSELADRLSDRFRLLTGGNRTSLPRHRTLRAVVEWSWELLTEPERLLAERLAVFPAGASVQAATEVCADDRLPAGTIAELLINLVDKSLLEHSDSTPVRFRMLETIREYGIEQLANRSELAAVRRRHADHFLRLVIDQEPRLRSADQAEARSIMERERDNVLAALRYLIDSRDRQQALIMVLGLCWYYVQRDAERELGYWLDQVIAANQGHDEPLLVYAEASRFLSDQRWLDDGEDAPFDKHLADLVERLEQAPEPPFQGLAVLRMQLGIFLNRDDEQQVEKMVQEAASATDPWIRGACYMIAGWVAENSGNRERMAEYSRLAYEEFALTGDSWGLAAAYNQRAQVLSLEGRVEEAIEVLERTMELSAVLGAGGDQIIGHLRLCGLHLRLGDVVAARRHLDRMRSTGLHQAMDRERQLLCDSVESAVLLLEGRREEAAGLVSRMRASITPDLLRNRFSAHASAMALAACADVELRLARDADPAERDRRTETARRDLATGYGPALLTEDVPIMAEFATVVAVLAEATGDPRRAALLLGAASTVVGQVKITDPRQRELQDRLCDRLGADGYAASFEAGTRLTRAEFMIEMDPARVGR